jgi:N-methylhydantoinase A
MTDVMTIGAGGGSIAWLDDGGLLRMGPQSAGADPGPIAYGLGGTEPTCTDANLVLGYLDPDYFLGGRMKLDVEAARAGIRTKIAEPLGLEVEAAAAAMHEVITLMMAAGTKDLALRRGYDPRELLLIGGGGAGGLHAGPIGAELELDRIVLPRVSSVLCAFGMLLADLRHDYVRSFHHEWDALDPAAAAALVAAMADEGTAALAAEGTAEADRSLLASAEIRYRGQHHEVSVPFDPADLAPGRLDTIAADFHHLHERLYGFSSPERPLETIALRVSVRGKRPELRLSRPRATSAEPPRRGSRRAWLPERGESAEVPVLDADAMLPGHRFEGPALVEGANTTVIVPEAYDLAVDASSSFVLHRKGLEEDS